MISLSKVTLSNFKVFGGNPYTISFDQTSLVLLDGPNGYGKTSVFDAIELGLTGNISRLISLESRQNPIDVVVAHQGTGNVEITLEFKDSISGRRVFQRKLKKFPDNSSKKISKFTELWELNEIVNGEPLVSSQSELDEYFDGKDFVRDFLLFHYVQQEETSRFLKTRNEAQRAEELAKLFGKTREADQKHSKFIDISKKIGRSKQAVIKKIDDIQQQYKIEDHLSLEIGGSEEHIYVLPWLVENSKTPFWDEITIPNLNQDKLNKSLEEISKVKGFLKHQSYFLRSRRFEKAIQTRQVIELYVGYFNAINDYDLHVVHSQSYQLIKSSKTIFESGDLEQIQAIKDLSPIFHTLELGSSVTFEKALRSVIDETSKKTGLSSIYTELLKHHDAMSSGHQRLPDESLCLFCGQDYQSHDSLRHAITQHGDLLRSELSGQDKLVVEARVVFNKIHLSPLIQACITYLGQTPPISQQDLLDLSSAVSIKDRFEKLRTWLMSENIEHDDLLITTFPVEGGGRNSIVEAADLLSGRIRSAIGTPPDGYYESNGSNVFDRIYRDYFDSNKNMLAQLDLTQFDKKESYIKSQYFSSLKNVSEELKKLSRQKELLELAAKELNELILLLRGRIKRYRKQLITDIEIPFYIYSGKILQYHQAGLGHGIFIKDPTGNEELKNVRLVSNWESDHDILNTMSSGQISAVVIALTLALNKVYAKKFTCILIDDPVQTMDDINMSSFVELLRNDFKDRQVVLSTHESKVSRYFTYKYLKHSKSVKIVNLMQRKEYIPSNKFLYSDNKVG